jgi:hypothetical protein
MAFVTRAASLAGLATVIMLAGCASENGNSIFTTGSLGSNENAVAAAPEPRVDPACVSLAARIEGLRKEGVAEKIEKAAGKKYKLTQTDMAKADQLTKANAEFQLRCSTITPAQTTAQGPSTAPPSQKKAGAPKTSTGSPN